MEKFQEWLQQPLIKNNAGGTVVSNGILAAVIAGGLGLYLMIPENKRKRLWK